MDIAREHYSLLCATCASLFSTPLMMAGVNAILPEIGNSFQASAATLALVGAAYSLGLAIFQLVTGSLGDILGHRRLFLAGALLFAVSSMFGAIVYSMPIFLILRFLQGIGGALLSAAGLALIASFAPRDKRASYLGLSGAAVYAGIACGPPVAGFITGAFDWRWLFWINAIANIGVYCLMKFSVKMEWRPASSQRFDWCGALLYGLVMFGLIMAAGGMNHSWLIAAAGFGLFVIAGCLFLIREKKASYPVLNLALLAANRVLRFSSWAALLNYSSLFGLLFYFSIYLQIVLGLTVQETGLVLAIQSLTQALVTPFATRSCKKYKLSVICATGAAACCAGLTVAAFLQPSSSLFLLILAQILTGAGISFFSLANTTLIIESGGKKNSGQSAALTGAMRTAGQLFSMILLTMSVSWFLGSAPVSSENISEFMLSMKTNLIFFALLNLIALSLSFGQNRIIGNKGG